jgi:HTH-type transcriptional regulator/antitoxin HigA
MEWMNPIPNPRLSGAVIARYLGGSRHTASGVNKRGDFQKRIPVFADTDFILLHNSKGMYKPTRLTTRVNGRNKMSTLELEKVTKSWPPVSQAVRVPHTAAEYDELVELLDHLIDEVGEDENHPLAALMDVLGVLIEKHEDEHAPELAA